MVIISVPPRSTKMSPHVLSIAGSDSGGGAGIQADLKTFTALGTYGMSVITALTAQNTRGVTAIHAPPATFVGEQFDAVLSDIRVDGIKIGMLANADIARTTAELLEKWRTGGHSGSIILDPVMVSTSGSLLLERDAIETVITELLPKCTLLTPNIAEAIQIFQHAKGVPAAHAHVSSITDIITLADSLVQLGSPAVLVKGGHNVVARTDLETQLESLGVPVRLGVAAGDAVASTEAHASINREADATSEHQQGRTSEIDTMAKRLGASCYVHGPLCVVTLHGPGDTRVLPYYSESVFDEESYTVDVLRDGHGTVLFIKPCVKTTATHGTGCTLSSAICALSARGESLRMAVSGGILYLQDALAHSMEGLGGGPGPLDHGAHITPREIPQRTTRVRAPLCMSLIARSWDRWCVYTHHAFTARMGQDTLSPQAFIWYLRQDYIYLRHYARIWAKAASDPSCRLDDIGRFAEVSQLVVKETEMHVALCAEWGVSREELELTPESRATMIYTRSMLDHATEGLLPLLVAVASCALGYAEVGLWLVSQRKGPTKFDKWINEYGGKDFLESVALIIGAS